jgi:hypothetical protein
MPQRLNSLPVAASADARDACMKSAASCARTGRWYYVDGVID